MTKNIKLAKIAVVSLIISLLIGSFSVSANTETIAINPFSDLSDDHKNIIAITYLYENEVIDGYPDETFKAENTVNRAELLKILVGGKGVSPTLEAYKDCFPDVQVEWYAPYVCYAKNKGWVEGYPDGTFKPENTVNKFEAVKMLINSQEYPVPHTLNEDIYWYEPFVTVAENKDLLEGPLQSGIAVAIDGPEGMTRGEISESIYRTMIVNKYSLVSYSWYQPDYLTNVDNINLYPINLRNNTKWDILIYPINEDGSKETHYFRVFRNDDSIEDKIYKSDEKTGLELETSYHPQFSDLSITFLRDEYLKMVFDTECVYPNLRLDCHNYDIKIPVQIENEMIECEKIYISNTISGGLDSTTYKFMVKVVIQGKNEMEIECKVKGIDHSPYDVYYTENSDEFNKLNRFKCFESELEAIEAGYQKAANN